MGKDNFGSGKSNNKATTGLHDGLKTRSPKAIDSSYRYPGGSVNADTTRSSTAPTPKTITGRTA